VILITISSGAQQSAVMQICLELAMMTC